MKRLAKIISARKMLLVFGILFSTSFLKSQSCNVTINNSLACDLQMDISFLEKNPSCVGCPGNPINVTVTNSGGSTALNCTNWGCANAICDISVTITSPIAAGPFLYSAGTAILSGLPVGCAATPGANISFTSTTIDINP